MKAEAITPVMVTVDNERAAHLIAERLGIEQVHAGVLPEGKAQIVRDLQQTVKVAMVGDRINDAPG
jgi:P-type E1-E2 ATPase